MIAVIPALAAVSTPSSNGKKPSLDMTASRRTPLPEYFCPNFAIACSIAPTRSCSPVPTESVWPSFTITTPFDRTLRLMYQAATRSRFCCSVASTADFWNPQRLFSASAGTRSPTPCSEVSSGWATTSEPSASTFIVLCSGPASPTKRGSDEIAPQRMIRICLLSL